MKSAKSRGIKRISTSDFPDKRRIGDQSSADHDAGEMRIIPESPENTSVLLCGINVSVVADGDPASAKNLSECIDVGIPVIKLPHSPCVDDQFADRITVKY